MNAFVPAGAGTPHPLCRYGESRLPFRAPRRQLDGDYVLFLGGTETFGKFIARPYPALLEEVLGLPCVNMGCVNAGIDAFMKDHTVVQSARQARAVVLQVTGAHNLSNRFYTVHPRRNDRFLRASTVLSQLYPEIDFADYSFTRHMLGDLRAADPTRFEIVVEEITTAWTARMIRFIEDLSVPVVLFWFADRLPDDPVPDGVDALQADPVYVNRDMIEALRPLAHNVVELRPSAEATRVGTAGMVFPNDQADAAARLLGVGAHRQASATLTGPLRRILAQGGSLPKRIGAAVSGSPHGLFSSKRG